MDQVSKANKDLNSDHVPNFHIKLSDFFSLLAISLFLTPNLYRILTWGIKQLAGKKIQMKENLVPTLSAWLLQRCHQIMKDNGRNVIREKQLSFCFITLFIILKTNDLANCVWADERKTFQTTTKSINKYRIGLTLRINMFSYSCKLDQYKMILYLLIVTTPT